ncbi:MAG: mandelate racemase/muconate lactonizing enzyme family protein [Aquamicrobium sp.]|nr:mandelate racemase/muconate lactonizing enzyme family protein [Aquamicrobium sp.]
MENGLSLRLHRAFLSYPAGQEVHTAASGRVESLHELFLDIEDRASGLLGQGEVRANIAFITGTPEAEVTPGVISLLERCDLSGSLDAFAASFAEQRAQAPRISQALVENALADLFARRAGLSVAEYLGGSWSDGVACNQCVFWGSDEAMRANAALYYRSGFRKIKLRVGIGSIEQDEARLGWLRSTYGDAVELALDANGAWRADEALAAIDRLRHHGVAYVEQPTRIGDWPALERVARECGLPVMIDEGLRTPEDVERTCALGGLVSAHLKIAKAGGVAALVAIGRAFDRHGVRYVVGQMNEGGLATAVAVHAAMALSPSFGELYGAMGILDDPAPGVTYHAGKVFVPYGTGVGLRARHGPATLIWRGGAS